MTPPAAQRAGARNRHRAVAGRLASLFDEHASMVLGLCRLLLRDHHEAEDAAQQTFVSAYRSLLRGTEPRDAAPWLAAIARNECRARIRKRMRAPLALEHELEEQLADPTDIVDESERRAELAALTAAIAALPSRQREAVALRDFLGLSYEEVASTLSVSVPVVESLLFRARRRLRDTVRTVPRYAAGLVAIPLAVRAAVSRELPELDSQSPGGAAGIAGAAVAGVLAKIVSLPFVGKAATAVTVVAVATAGPQVPQLFDGDTGGSRSAVSAPRDSPGPPAATVEDTPSKPPFEASSAPASPEPAASEETTVAATTPSSAPAEAEAEAMSEEPATTSEPPAVPIEPLREVFEAGSIAGTLEEPPAPAESQPQTLQTLEQAPPAAEPAEVPPPASEPATTPAPPSAPPPLVGGTPDDQSPGPDDDGSGDGSQDESPDAPDLPPAPPSEEPPPGDDAACGDPADGLAPAGHELAGDRLAEAERHGGRGQQCPLGAADGS